MLPIISVLGENTLLKPAYHFLPLLVGFDTLTYRKDYDRSPTLVGHHKPSATRVDYSILIMVAAGMMKMASLKQPSTK